MDRVIITHSAIPISYNENTSAKRTDISPCIAFDFKWDLDLGCDKIIGCFLEKKSHHNFSSVTLYKWHNV